MSIFGAYARYYDLLYRDKDYAAEAEYVAALIRRFAPNASSVLELGCGTGGHAGSLTAKGYSIHGVDISSEMLRKAKERFNESDQTRVTFSEGDLRTLRLNRKFGAVISLFHVMSYQQSNDDLNAAFATAREHLEEGGVFIFDCWYGPAVLTDRPAVRVKRFEDDALQVTRLAEPVMHPESNLVDVNYHILLHDKTNGARDEIRETHRMRYLFCPEVELLLRLNRLSLVHSSEWLTDHPVSFNSWSACFVAA